MYELKKNGKVFTSKFVGTGPSSYNKIIYRAVVSQSLRNTALQRSVTLAYLCYAPSNTAHERCVCSSELSRVYGDCETDFSTTSVTCEN